MRALLDANLYISYLLSRNRTKSAVGAVLAAVASGAFTLLFTAEIADEINRSTRERPDLATRIAPADVRRLLLAVAALAEMIPSIQEDLPRVGRDRGDDYLIAHAIAAGADVPVSWDKDLLDLGQVAGVRIVTPPRFLEVLRETGRLTR